MVGLAEARVIGITGTIGAGKGRHHIAHASPKPAFQTRESGAIVDFLRQRGFKWFSVRDFLLQEISKRGLPPVSFCSQTPPHAGPFSIFAQPATHDELCCVCGNSSPLLAGLKPLREYTSPRFTACSKKNRIATRWQPWRMSSGPLTRRATS